MTKVISIFAIGLAIGLAACGSAPASLELCHQQCDAQRRCGTLTDANASNCHTNCDNNKGALADQDATNDKNCKNAGDVRSAQHSCLSEDCNKIDSCLAVIDTTCVVK